ncbi:MAG: hypothetical protein ACKVTZ_19105, partial [Bacteroidia bacterium]
MTNLDGMKRNLCFFILGVMLCLSNQLFAQYCTVKGKVTDAFNKPLESVTIRVVESEIVSLSDSSGKYSVQIPVVKPRMCKILFQSAGYQDTQLELEIKDGYIFDKPINLKSLSLSEISVTANKNNSSQIQTISLKAGEAVKMPSFNPSVEALLQSQGGVVTNNEFSSQYRVRGGNFDENLVYVNGIEVYRPFLARQGQMEGLGFANRSLVDNIAFSTGGFPAQYGDKMSSVLDITYRNPTDSRGSAELGIITNSLHLEGISKNKKNPDEKGKFTYLTGARFFTLSYLLNSLDTKGNYKPLFMDWQGMFTYTPIRGKGEPCIVSYKNGELDTLYDPIDKLKFTGFFTAARNRFQFEPTGAETSFGTIQQAFRLRTGFEGQEYSTYTTLSGAISAEHRPNAKLKFQHIISHFSTEETERFDVEGGYLLSEVNTQLGSEEFGNDSYTLGTGSIFRHARNYLTVNVSALETKGEWIALKHGKYQHKLFWGAKAELHQITDAIKEYNLFDSAQYVTIPSSGGIFGVSEYIKGDINFFRQVYRAYFQHEWLLDKKQAASLTSGVRGTYDGKIKQFFISPRIQFAYDFSKINKDLRLRLRAATGIYHQPPFYREFRRHDGTPAFNLDAQTSVHYIVGADYTFTAWKRDFKVFTELYFKDLYNIVPYEIQNVRIRYYPYPDNQVGSDYNLAYTQGLRGFAYGIDARLNGQFSKGTDSWLTISYLKTMEQLNTNDANYLAYLNPFRSYKPTDTFIPRPTDQRFSFSMYFQDELPINPTYKVHINYVFGTGMRFGLPDNFKYRTNYTYPAYQRVDIGFSKMFLYRTTDQMETRKHGFQSLWATLEVFNLFARLNTVSYNWIKDLDNRQFAVPNQLSGRLLNVR